MLSQGLLLFCCQEDCKRAERKTNVDNRQTALCGRGILAVLVGSGGIVLRIREIQPDGFVAAEDVWFDTVRVTNTDADPTGSTWRGLSVSADTARAFAVLGNKITVALDSRQAYRFLAGILCYFAVRRLTGPAAAVTALGFGNAPAIVLEGSSIGTGGNFIRCYG